MKGKYEIIVKAAEEKVNGKESGAGAKKGRIFHNCVLW